MHSRKKSLISLASAAVLMFLAVLAHAADLYVDVNTGLDTNMGTAAAPYKTIQQGINFAAAGDTIHVAAGNYPESLQWSLKDLTIQGAGEGVSIIDPSIANGGPGGRCLLTLNLTNNSHIDGFTFTNGAVNGLGGGGSGGGIFSSRGDMTVSNCTFTQNTAINQGGGMAVSEGNPIVRNCTFIGNMGGNGGGLSIYFSGYFSPGPGTTVTDCKFIGNAASEAGGIRHNQGTASITNCTFTQNTASDTIGGGGMVAASATTSVTNCTFSNNTSPNNGVMLTSLGSTTLTNCTLSNNSATGNGIGINALGSPPNTSLTNCIVWGSTPLTIVGAVTITYSDVQGGYLGMGNINADPLFTDAANNDVRLMRGSPCRNVGNTAVVTSPPFLTDNGLLIDLDGNPRLAGSGVDMGAYEVQNAAPVANNDAYSINQDTTLNVTAPGVLANDTDADSDPLTAILVSGPSHGSLSLNANGSFTYTPNAGYYGADSFTYKANDGTLDSNVATVNLMVNHVNHAPVANSQSVTTNEDTPYSGTLTGSDVDGDTLTFATVSDPAHGTVTVNTNGSFTYTPSANYNGPDSFTFKANDGLADSNTATVSITVNPVNDPPVANNDAYSINQDTTLNVAAPGVLANDTDVDGNALTAVLVSGPSHGTLTLHADGSFTFTPASGYSGPDSFTYKANDGTANSNVATVNLTVNAVATLVIEQVTIKRTGNSAAVSFNLRNTGSVTATNVKITDATLSGAVSKPAVPIMEKNISGGASLSDTLSFKVGSGLRLLTIVGTSSLGSFSYSQYVQVP